MKRSAAIVIVAAGVALAACSESPDTFSNVTDCMKNGNKTMSECSTAYAEAQKDHAKTAPKFTSKEQCEAQYGVGKCERPPEVQAQAQQTPGTPPAAHAGASSGSSFSDVFMPAMMGYMIGSMMSSGSSSPARSVYYDREGRTYSGGTATTVRPTNNFVARSPNPSYTSSRSGISSSSGGSYGSTARGFSAGSGG